MSIESWLKSKGILEPVEQIAHFWMGVGAGLTNLGLLLWWREWVQQWPPGDVLDMDTVDVTPIDLYTKDMPSYVQFAPLDRVKDTGTDLFWMEVGRTVAWFVVLGLGIWGWMT